MRLLNTSTLTLTEFTRDVPPYAILSHTWGDEEVTFQEIGRPERNEKKGFGKIQWCCQQARRDTLAWAWVDTCCIDKTSSAELSEAINSMYNWYREAQVCYVYLEDVPDPGARIDSGLYSESESDDEDESGSSLHPVASRKWDRRFRSARWFTRGWCLQELIAPPAVEFYSAGWREIGTKLSLCRHIHQITGIPSKVLLDPDSTLDGCCLAQRMSWAASRKTSRVEDEAYCLLGIFGVHMPLLYGEGERAFYRLQEEIIRQTEDYSFLLWSEAPRDDGPLASRYFPIFARRPAYFRPDRFIRYPFPKKESSAARVLTYTTLLRHPAGSLEGIPRHSSAPTAPLVWDPPQMTNRGLRVSLLGRVVPEAERQRRSWDLTVEGQYLLFTGFSYNGLSVCIHLVQDKLTGPDCYTRLDNLVHLVPFSEMLERFAPRAIYLSTARRPPWNSPAETRRNPSNPPIRAHLLIRTLAPAYTLMDAAWVTLLESPFPVALKNLGSYTNAEPDATVVGTWTGRLDVSAARPSHHALDVTIQRNVNRAWGSPPPQTVRVSMNLQGRLGRSTCALALPGAQAAVVGSDLVWGDLEDGWVARARIKTMIRSSGSLEITLTLGAGPGPSSQPGS